MRVIYNPDAGRLGRVIILRLVEAEAEAEGTDAAAGETAET
jgi:hypothetical protein